uniref:BPTI/Kunitz inhibitor domain-containing protein n=1 Tax=Anolis carolinensis TaxID=28377 RepID=A0A803TZQ6_ANOCA
QCHQSIENIDYKNMLDNPERWIQETICSLPRETGRCRRSLRRFYFNIETGQCEIFLYGGCGNDNNFHSVIECLQMCRFGKK